MVRKVISKNETTAMIDCLLIDSSKIEALLGITIDHELKCNDQVNNGKKQEKNLMHLPVSTFYVCLPKTNYHEAIY